MLRCLLVLLAANTFCLAQPAAFPGRQSLWNGYRRYDFQFAERPAIVVAPKTAAPGKPWLWRGEFFGAFPSADIALLGRGFHILYLQDPNQFGAPATVQRWNAFYAEVTQKYGLARKPALLGMSRGGLYCYAWAAANPDKVACIYGDAPVCDIKSWPGGKGKGKGSPRDWAMAMEVLGLKDEAAALAWKRNPIDVLKPLADAKVPIIHVYGDADDVVPADENTLVLAERYKALGGEITLIGKPGIGHHPHGLPDPTSVVDFICKHSGVPASQ
jgi:pimeloyl-ACP methyl ester carboxylesterase